MGSQNLKSIAHKSLLFTLLTTLVAIMVTDMTIRSVSANPSIKISNSKLQYGRAESFSCPQYPNGSYINGLCEDPEVCANYYDCWEGTYIHSTCRNGMVYNTTYKGCESPILTYCGNRVRPDGTTDMPTAAPPVSTTPTPPAKGGPGFVCTPDTYHPDIYNCSNYYHCDMENNAIKQPCPATTEFNNKTKQCDWPKSSGCKAQPQPILQ